MQYEGAHYHIWSKGNGDDYILNGDEDKSYFVDLLSQGHVRHKVDIYAYCVLGNHYHLHIQTPHNNMPEFMHFMGSCYGTYLARNKWKGHVFSSRYNSKYIDTEEQLKILSRYIHLNPVKAGITKLPEQYHWSSYIYYLAGARPPSWLNTRWIVDYFGPGVEEAAERYREFVLAGVNKGIADSGEITAIERAYEGICEIFNLESLDEPGFESKENLRNARSLFIFFAKKYSTLENNDIARMIGDIGPKAVSNHYHRICAKIREDAGSRQHLYKELFRLINEYKIYIDEMPSTNVPDTFVDPLQTYQTPL